MISQGNSARSIINVYLQKFGHGNFEVSSCLVNINLFTIAIQQKKTKSGRK